jgi:hypothetical protein
MKIHRKITSGILFLAFTFLASYTNAQANCAVMINSLPYVITSGYQKYCLGKNLSYNATDDNNLLGHYSIPDLANFWADIPNINFTAAIVVAAPSVTLDLSNRTLSAKFLVPNRVAVAVYGNNVSNFRLQNGTIKGFDTGAYVTSTNSVVVNKVIFDKTKLTAITSYAPRNNSVTNNIVTNFSSVSRWPMAPVGVFYVGGGREINDTITVTNNRITSAVGNIADGHDVFGTVWGMVGASIAAPKGIVNVSGNTFSNITANGGVSASLAFTGDQNPQITIRKNKFTFPLNHPSLLLQNVAVWQAGSGLTQADSNYFSGFHTQFLSFTTGTPLIFSNNVFELYSADGNYPPLFYNYTNPNPVDAGGNVIIRN